MNPRKIRVLLIEDNPGDARLVREVLSETPEIGIHAVDRISLGIEYLISNQTDVVLLDLGLPDSQGLNSLRVVYDAAPHVPVVVLTGHDDETVGQTAIRQGAQDYIVKPVTQGRALARILRFAVERKISEEELRAAHDRAEWLARFPEENPNPVLRASIDGIILYCNPGSMKIRGWEYKDGQRLADPVLPLFEQSITEEQAIAQDIEIGGRFYSIAIKQIPEKGYANIYGTDITERKCAELREQLAREVLEILNHLESPTQPIRDILQLIKNSTGFEAVGIRLREGDDFPYYEANGFSEDFIQSERYLCECDEEGKIIRDEQGHPVLECMCGNILCLRTDPALPFFTERGSFWTNSTTDLQASMTEEERQARTRNRCNGEGYESVALIPLRSGEEIIGLLQLNDRRRDRFTLKTICFFEGLAASIGIALARKQAEEEVRKYSAELTEKNEELRAMTQQLWQAAKLATMGELAASIAHELNNPLATVSLRAESLLRKTRQDNPMWRESENHRTGSRTHGNSDCKPAPVQPSQPAADINGGYLRRDREGPGTYLLPPA